MIGTKRQRAKYVVGDFFSTNLACLLFNVVRYYFDNQIVADYGSLTRFLSSPMVVVGQAVFPLVLLGVYYLSGYYNGVFLKSRLKEFVTTATTALVGMIIIFFVAIVNDHIAGRAFAYELMLLLFGILFVPVYLVRYSITRVATRKIHNREWSFNTLIVGTSVTATKLEQRLREMKKSMGFNVVGYVQILDGELDRELNLPVYKISEIEEVCARLNIKNLIVIPHRHGIKATMSLVNSLLPLDCPIYISPDLYQLLTSKVRISNVVGEPLVDISRTQMSPSTRNLKRVSDVVISFFTLLLISPLLLVIAILVKCDSRGPVFYRQQRIGYHKKPFYIYKFRSMRVDAEVSGPALSTLNDPRITRLGRVLRKYRLDELPNFWNVLRGDMSIVGPRPEREYYIKQILAKAPYYTLIHQVRPGITSWGMVKYGYASDVDGMIERLKYDLLYIENVSMLVDLKILFYTVQIVVTGKGI
ncbi:MAG: sugar transferase [Muribaculaceae bacterium]|nr:sugar transferase [Muribaculaceae bacterium]